MWDEPLSNAIRTIDAHRYQAIVHDGRGRVVAQAPCIVNTETRCGFYGAMQIIDPNGGMRQRRRALVLLTRAALAHAQAIGIVDVRTDVPDALREFAEIFTGPLTRREGARFTARGDVRNILQRALERTDANGDLRN